MQKYGDAFSKSSSRGDRASSALGHVRHMAIFSIQVKIWSWETYLGMTCGALVCMSIQELHLKGCIDFVTENSFFE